MNIKSILQVSFSDQLINTFHQLGFKYEIEPERGTFGHYNLYFGNPEQNLQQNLFCKSLWIGIDYKGRVMIDILVECLDETRLQAFAVNNSKNIDILDNIISFVTMFKNSPELAWKIVKQSSEFEHIDPLSPQEVVPFKSWFDNLPNPIS